MHVLNLACVKRELHFLHVSKFSMCKQRGEADSSLLHHCQWRPTWHHRLPHELTQSSVRAAFLLLRPPMFLDAPLQLLHSTSTHPRKASRGKTDEKKLPRKIGKGTSTLRGGRLLAKARRIPCLHATQLGPPPDRRLHRWLCSPPPPLASARGEMPFRLLKAPPERRRRQS